MLKFKLPKLHKQSAEWVVEYYIQHPETMAWHRYKEREGLNKKGITKKEREAIAANHIADITRLLKEGILNPWLVEVKTTSVETTISEAISLALEKKNLTLGERSKGDYKTTEKYFRQALKELGKSNIPVKQFTRRHFIDTLDYMTKEFKCTPHRINIHQQYLSALMTVLVDKEMIEVNPLFRLSKRKEPEPVLFDPPTDEEQRKIDTHLFEHHRPLFVYKSIIYVTGARPFELLEITAGMVNFEREEIELSRTKAGKRKTIPLTDDLVILLKDHLQGTEPTDYVFAKHGSKAELLKPGPDKITNRNTASNAWREIVIEGLCIDSKMYSQKHKGTDDKILLGIPLEYLKEIYGHSSTRMTEKYASKLKTKALEVIKKKSPGIIPKG